jgi:alpha-tubulin suppressor-like RCC1 family protein
VLLLSLAPQDLDTPVGLKVLSEHSIRYISCGWAHSLAVSHAGDLYAWGQNDHGQLGLGVSTNPRLVPALVRRLPDGWQEQQEEVAELVEAAARRIGECTCSRSSCL